jgi:hypothetical protein
VAGAVARAFGVAWAIGGGGALMLLYSIWAFQGARRDAIGANVLTPIT